MVAKLSVALLMALAALGCGESPSGDAGNLAAQPAQPPADLEKGKNAQTMEEWAKANPNNGAMGSGETETK